MSFTDILAIIGALAWTPPIFLAIRAWITKPKIRIITQLTPEIGFTTLGPIFNIRIALTVSHKDIVITGIRLQLTHESGEKVTFSWQGIIQRMGTMTYPQVGTVPFEKELNVLAMKVSPKDVEERFIRFQNLSYLKRKADLDAISLKKLAYLRQSNTFEGEPFLRSQEMVDLYSYIRQSFTWKPGIYHLRVILEAPDAFEVLDDSYSFELSPIQVQDLSENLNKLEQSYANEVLPPKEGEQMKQIVWNWVYPDIHRD